MTIKKDQKFIFRLFEILKFIGSDKPFAAIKFEMELEVGINGLIDFLYKYRQSKYFNDERYRDFVFKGYTIVYKVETDTILILYIFKWQKR